MLVLILFCVVIAIILAILIQNYKKSSYYKVTEKNYFSMLFDAGSFGEYLTYKYLQGYEKKGSKFLFNLYLPRDNGETTEIDILMIAPSGLYVFESKNYSGWIFGNENGKTWTQTLPQGKKSHKEHFLNPIMQNRLHIKWLNNLLENEKIPVHSVIVFSERCTLKKVEVYSKDIKVIKRDQIYGTVSQIDATIPVAISEAEINELYEKLYVYTQISNADKQKHIENIKQKQIKPLYSETVQELEQVQNKKQADTYICPQCGAMLVVRTAKQGENKGKQFYGCSAYPKCRYIKNIE